MGEKRIYDNPWIGVTEYDVLNPSGGKGIYGKVFFKNLAIGAVPLDGDGYTWLVGQYRFPLDRYSWEIPEGGGDVREAPVESAKRELLEETGLVAQHVPYKAASAVLTDVLGGRIQLQSDSVNVLMPQIQAGKLVPLMATSPRRLAQLDESSLTSDSVASPTATASNRLARSRRTTSSN